MAKQISSTNSNAEPHSETPQPPGAPKKKKFFVWLVIAVICITVILACGFQLGQAGRERQRNEQVKELAGEAPSSVRPKPAKTGEPEASASATSTPSKKTIYYGKQKKENEREINFTELSEQNPDTVAWLEVPGTNIDYPVVTTTDNDHYLHYDFLGEKSEHGAIYMDVSCDLNFEDPVSIFYGHNMKDGTMFADLHKFSDPEFLKEHSLIKVYTPEGEMDYRIFAVYKNDDGHLLSGRNLRNPTLYQEFLDEIAAKEGPDAQVDMTGISIRDSLLTLSTCVRGEDENRFVIQAVFIAPEGAGDN